jgi:hypothetical protein
LKSSELYNNITHKPCLQALLKLAVGNCMSPKAHLLLFALQLVFQVKGPLVESEASNTTRAELI